MGTPWLKHVTNEAFLRKIGTERKLLPMVRMQQLEFFGHAMRKESLEYTLTRPIEGDENRGRP